jgi:hypothetical protein
MRLVLTIQQYNSNVRTKAARNTTILTHAHIMTVPSVHHARTRMIIHLEQQVRQLLGVERVGVDIAVVGRHEAVDAGGAAVDRHGTGDQPFEHLKATVKMWG